ncbi:CPBP family intramembrane glutamic endopeptidase [Demequina flava]|uniref:CPBP family intramembrane glutamic endopeptidase n=1 Tax=Demequina flava TaxID=1095025 RepID=UPI00191C6EE9|nr:type II CAAX endopeptidase family protein [Demequina flava]
MTETPPRRTHARTAAIVVFTLGTLLCFLGAPIAVDVFTDHEPWALITLALVELALAVAIVAWWLRRRRLGADAVGATRAHWKRDAAWGAATVVPRFLLEFAILIPLAGGIDNDGVQEVLRNIADGAPAFAAALILGVVGGGIAEELYFRGFLIGAVPREFANRKRARAVAIAVSIVLFSLLHLPATMPDLISILVASVTYVALFAWTDRLTAPIVAHSLWNIVAVLGVAVIYG